MSQYKSPLVSCLNCRKQLSFKGLNTHFISMHTSEENHKRVAGGKHRKTKNLTSQQIDAINRRNLYNANPIICKQCNKPHSYNTKNNKFCSSSCAAIYNNNERSASGWKLSESSRQLISLGTTGFYRGKPKKINPIIEIVGPYTKIYLRTCKFSKLKWYSRTTDKIHPSLKSEYQKYSAQCRFKFGLSSYTEWFLYANELILKHGWYASASRTHTTVSNLNGVSRDHKISVNYGYRNNIDPKIISHPANCEIMQHRKNNSKNSECSITLEQLLLDIEKFNNTYHNLRDLNPA